MSRPSVRLWGLLAIYIVYGSLLPFCLVADRSLIAVKMARLTFNPFVSPDTDRRISMTDAAQNVALFLPFGFVGVLALDRRLHSTAVTIMTVAAIGATLSATVEALQLFTADRTTSFADLTACTIGSFAGAAVCSPLASWWARSRAAAHARALVDRPAFYPTAAAFFLVWMAAWQPFDLTLDVGVVAVKVHALRSDPWQAAPPGEVLTASGLCLALGLTLGLLLRQAGVPAAARAAAITGCLAVSAFEAGKWFIASRMPGLQSEAIGVTATTAGAVASLRWPYRRSPMFWWTAWCILTAVGGMLDLSVPMERHLMPAISRTFEAVVLVSPVVYGWSLIRRQPDS